MLPIASVSSLGAAVLASHRGYACPMRSGFRRGIVLASLTLATLLAAPVAHGAEPTGPDTLPPTLTVFHGTGPASGQVRLAARIGRLRASAMFKRITSASFKGRVRNLLGDQLADGGLSYDRCHAAPLVTVSRYRSDGWATLSFVGVRFSRGTAPQQCRRAGGYWLVLHLSQDLAHQQPGLRFRAVAGGVVGAMPACADLASAGVPAELWVQPCLQDGQPAAYEGPPSPVARVRR